MQTFMPLPDYWDSMRTLDKRRLGNQVWREGYTLIQSHWPHHPAAKMWQGHFDQLGLYLYAGTQVMREREWYKPKIVDKWAKIYDELRVSFPTSSIPSWMGNEEFHASHRSNLLRKDPEWYGQFGWTESDDLPYVWPIP